MMLHMDTNINKHKLMFSHQFERDAHYLDWALVNDYFTLFYQLVKNKQWWDCRNKQNEEKKNPTVMTGIYSYYYLAWVDVVNMI